MTQAVCDVVPTGNLSATGAAELARAIHGIDGFAERLCAPESAGKGDLTIWVVAATDVAVARSLIAAAADRWKRPRGGRAAVMLVAAFEEDLADIAPLEVAGVADFIVLPARARELALRLERATTGLRAGRSEQSARAGIDPRLDHAIGASPVFLAALAQLPKMAQCDAGVLILGETGTGKEVVAQAIHTLSRRADAPCVVVNCAALPVDLVESELFGHVKGAFTTAHAARDGLVTAAEGGTLFLDDVDGLPLAAQAKLLRFLQSREYRPVGSNGVRRADVRVIAASNHDLASLAARGAFRPDLFYRLNVLNVRLPPLRERRSDIPLLAQHFLAVGGGGVGLTPAAQQRLAAYDWPGNVRELQHVIERCRVLAGGALVDAPDLAFDADVEVAQPAASFAEAKRTAVTSFERSLIENLLIAHHGNVTRAAAAAKKNRRAFVALMRKYAIASSDYRPPAGR